MAAGEPEIVCLPFAEHNYVYDDVGHVIAWGPPNVPGCLASVPDLGVLEVEAWKTWHVNVCWQRAARPWFLSDVFYVEHFEHIHRHWAMYFDRGQRRTDRISVEVECWLFSLQGGWEYCNYM